MASHDALSFEELRELFLARGYHKTPLSVAGLAEKPRAVLLTILRALVRERDEEAEVQQRLLARNQELERHVQRAQRDTKQTSSQTHATESRLHAMEVQLHHAQRALRDEQATHKATREQLSRTRKQMQQIRSAAAQHRTVTDRGAERLRDRMASLSMANLKGLVPDIRIASPAFVTQPGAAASEAGLVEQQLAAAEQRNVALLDATHALKQLAADALASLHHADVRLQKILDVEVLHRSQSRMESEPTLAHLFPPLRPLVTEDTEETHPARKRLGTLSRALQEQVAALSQWAAMRRVQREGVRPLRAEAEAEQEAGSEAEAESEAEAVDTPREAKRRRTSEGV